MLLYFLSIHNIDCSFYIERRTLNMKNITLVNGKFIAYLDERNEVKQIQLPVGFSADCMPEVEINSVDNTVCVNGINLQLN